MTTRLNYTRRCCALFQSRGCCNSNFYYFVLSHNQHRDGKSIQTLSQKQQQQQQQQIFHSTRLLWIVTRFLSHHQQRLPVDIFHTLDPVTVTVTTSQRRLSSNTRNSNNNDNNDNNDSTVSIDKPTTTTTSTTAPPTTTSNNAANSAAAAAAAGRCINSNSDPPIVTWVEMYIPPSLQPYAKLSRMDKPIGTWLLLWPCYWSSAMAASAAATTTTTTTAVEATNTATSSLLPFLADYCFPDPFLLSWFTVGAFVMRGAGCTINDWWDQDYDKQVRRTQSRPLASGQITSHQAIQWLAAQLFVGCGILVSLPHTIYTFGWGVTSLPLVVIYPLMKRYTRYPQLVLGMTFNWGCWMGWAATFGTMDYAVITPLYVSGIAWTMVYDTIYANQDKEDDAAIGLKSTALTFGAQGDDEQKRILHVFAALAYASWLLSGYNLYANDSSSVLAGPFSVYGVGVTTAYAHLIWQIQTADFDNPHNLAQRFRSNSLVGGLVFASIVAGNATTAATIIITTTAASMT
jgi:4-hydroxybenzoate polyprenyltransferase